MSCCHRSLPTRSLLVAALCTSVAVTAFADGAGDVKKAFKSGDKDQVLAALKQITGHLDDDATRALVDNAARLKGLGVYDELVACLRSGGTDVVGELSKAYKKQKRGDVRFLIVDALGPNADTGAEATLAEALEKDKDEPVRVLAARLLGQRRTPSAVDVLIGALGKLEGDAKAARLAREVNGALCNLTGQDISVVEDWRNYWSSNKDSFNAGGGSDEPDDGKTRSAVDRMKRERPAEMKTMLRMKQDGIVCIKGRSDKVEKVLDALELKHDVVEHEAFDALTLKPEEQILIFNCPGGADYSDAGVQKVRDFVGAGGYVFCSDWSLKKLLVKAFPEAVEYQGQSPKRDKNDHLLVRIQPFKETVDHPLMRDVFPLNEWKAEAGFAWHMHGGSQFAKPNKLLTPLVRCPDVETSDELKSLSLNPAVAFTFLYAAPEGSGTGGGMILPEKALEKAKLKRPPGRVLFVSSHFEDQKEAGDGFALQQLLLNFILDKQAQRKKFAER